MASRSALNGIALVPESFHVDVVVNLLVPDCSSQITSALYPFFSITLSVQVITPVEEIDISGDIDFQNATRFPVVYEIFSAIFSIVSGGSPSESMK